MTILCVNTIWTWSERQFNLIECSFYLVHLGYLPHTPCWAKKKANWPCHPVSIVTAWSKWNIVRAKQKWFETSTTIISLNSKCQLKKIKNKIKLKINYLSKHLLSVDLGVWGPLLIRNKPTRRSWCMTSSFQQVFGRSLMIFFPKSDNFEQFTDKLRDFYNKSDIFDGLK